EDFERLFAINVRGVFLGMKTVAPVMQRAGSGSIINISSLAGLVAAPGAFAYGASKWAVRGMTKTAAVELAKYGVRCNSIHPGMIETDMLDQVTLGDDGRRQRMLASVPLGRVAEPLDIARMALFLASDESRYATGAEFVVDGGSHAL
ncbi:MAG: SDR family oxidoreductase, partial [Gammaproteobacteria bacterium]|nr:SDR family oxidoreductase [Gammaproteobacteria bacterium]